MSDQGTPDPLMQAASAAAATGASPSSPTTTTSTPFLHSSPPDAEEDTFMRAADTPVGSSPAPTGVTIETSRKRKYRSGTYGDADDEDDDVEAKPTKKGRKVGTGKAKKGIDCRAIPRTYEECEDIDKKLLSMRDGGSSWPDIRSMWKDETGEESGKSTLPNRYMRLKLNFTVIDDKDNALLLRCHREVDEAFEKERWSLVSTAMTREGSQVYLPETLQRQFKKLMHQGANLRAGRDLDYGLEEAS